MKRLLLILLLPFIIYAQSPPPPPAQPVILAWDTPVIEPSLIGGFVINDNPINLTTVGVTDWINWSSLVAGGPPLVNRKITGGSQIGNINVAGVTIQYDTGGRLITWSDGMPTVSNATDIVYWLQDGGFTFTVPADTIPRSLMVYLGVWSNATGRVKATLSDGSIEYSDVIPPASNGINDRRIYTITYRASKPNEKLTFEFSVISGWIHISSAALVQGVPDWYNVYRSETAGSYNNGPMQTNIATLSFTDTSVQRGKTYYYIVRTANTGVESINSNEVMAVVPNQPYRPNAPINLRVVSPLPK